MLIALMNLHHFSVKIGLGNLPGNERESVYHLLEMNALRNGSSVSKRTINNLDVKKVHVYVKGQTPFTQSSPDEELRRKLQKTGATWGLPQEKHLRRKR